MPTYRAPLDDIRFLFQDVLGVERLAALPGFEEATPDLLLAVLEEGARLCEEVLAPINQRGDAEGCRFENGVVTTPGGFREAYETYRAGGWPALTGDPAYGKGAFFAASGRLNQVTVVDTRDGDVGFNVAASVSDFTAAGNKSFSGNQLGWTPRVNRDTALFTDALGNTYNQTTAAGSPVAQNTQVSSGNGLHGLRERAAAVGATVVTTTLDPGFSLKVVTP